MLNINKIKILNRDSLVLLSKKIFNFRAVNRLIRQGLCEKARDNLVLLSKKIFNFFERLGYVRAVNRLTRQGLYEEARDSLVLLSKKIFNFFERLGYVRAVNRLIRQGLSEEAEVLILDLKERMKRTKLGYNPSKHYIIPLSPFMSVNFEK